MAVLVLALAAAPALLAEATPDGTSIFKANFALISSA